MLKIDIEMPEYCYDCPCQNGEYGRCNLTGKSVCDVRPGNCPLIPNERHTEKVDGIMLTIGEDGVAREYDNTYDIIIHCESKEEQEKALEIIRCRKDSENGKEAKEARWIHSSVYTDQRGCEFAKCKCSNCGHEEFAISYNVEKGNYCPNCGAYMRGGENR